MCGYAAVLPIREEESWEQLVARWPPESSKKTYLDIGVFDPENMFQSYKISRIRKNFIGVRVGIMIIHLDDLLQDTSPS